jgi:rSAM/selenodomain-associated transferase 2
VNAPVRTEGRIAVIIPVLNEAENIGALLDDLSRHVFAQTIVVDGGSADDTVEIAQSKSGVEVVRAGRGRGRQLNIGAARAGADVLLFLHADTRLPDGACGHIRSLLDDPAIVGGCFRLTFDARHPLLRTYAAMSAFDSVFTTFGDQAYFVRARAFDKAGAFPPWPILEDVEFRRRVRRQGRFVKLRTSVTTSARRFKSGGIVRQQVKNTLILCAFLAGVPAERLARWYAPHRGD